jgi:hypothetical protein
MTNNRPDPIPAASIARAYERLGLAILDTPRLTRAPRQNQREREEQLAREELADLGPFID